MDINSISKLSTFCVNVCSLNEAIESLEAIKNFGVDVSASFTVIKTCFIIIAANIIISTLIALMLITYCVWKKGHFKKSTTVDACEDGAIGFVHSTAPTQTFLSPTVTCKKEFLLGDNVEPHSDKKMEDTGMLFLRPPSRSRTPTPTPVEEISYSDSDNEENSGSDVNAKAVAPENIVE